MTKGESIRFQRGTYLGKTGWVIDAMEGCDVATVDIPGAFMQADIDEVVHVKFEGEIAEMLVKLDPKLYRKYVKDENG